MKTTLFQKALALLLCAVLLLTGIPAIGLHSDAATKAKPQTGTAYKMVMNTNGTDRYFNGQTDSVSYRLATTTSLSEAVDVYVEANGSGYALYFNGSNGKTYIRVYEREDGDPGWGKGSLELVTSKPAEVLTYDSAADTLIYTADDGENAYYMGTYGTYTTFSVSNTYYITGDKASTVDVSQYPARLVKSDGSTQTPTQPTTPPASAETADKYVTSVKAGTAYKLGMYQSQNKTNLYFNGQVDPSSNNRLNAAAKSAAVDVYLESASGGYRLYFMDGNTKTYIRVYAYFREGEQYPRGSIELTTEAPQEILTYNSQWNTLVYQYDQDNSFFMGTYGTYTTFSASSTYYITGDKASTVDVSQYPARLYASSASTAAPKITSQPTSVNQPAGTTAKFTVKASGTGLKYQWQYRTSSTGTWKNCSATGSKTATVKIPATASRNGFQYRCKVTNSAGKSVNSKAATLNVVTLKITAQPANKTVPTGTTAKFTVKATGSSLKYQWQYRTSSTGAWKNVTATGNKTATVKVPATATRNGFQYRCKITDKYGNAIYSNVVTLKTVILKVTAQPANKVVAAGTNAKFTVKASGTGLTYQWQFRKSADGKWFNNTSASSKTNALSIGATASRNGFQYRCKITDKYGNVIYSNIATLTVKK